MCYSQFMDPFLRHYAYHLKGQKIDFDKMKQGCRYFLGKHNFSSFRATGSANNDPVREIYAMDIVKKDKLITISVIGDGFLYKMVRIMVGTLLQVGRGKLEPKDIISIIKAQDRGEAGPTAKPHGLFFRKGLV